MLEGLVSTISCRVTNSLEIGRRISLKALESLGARAVQSNFFKSLIELDSCSGQSPLWCSGDEGWEDD